MNLIRFPKAPPQAFKIILSADPQNTEQVTTSTQETGAQVVFIEAQTLARALNLLTAELQEIAPGAISN